MSEPESPLETILVKYHYDPTHEEWVVRLHAPNSITSICGCPGEHEARTLAACVSAVAAAAGCTFTVMTDRGDKCQTILCENLIEFDAMSDAVNEAADLILGFT